ncbi:hypothetical protein KFE25_001334 [Diacronema lutheri]|uniref:GTPase Era n=1 Tax=Diacronema lutheri TaxID=2081491 RepID=A0A8J5XA61_DIALT|nr:hypothetical protein KFE25_001334 [Diacronema lutheri]
MPSWTAGLLAALALPLVLPIALGARLSRAGVARVQPLRAPSARHAMAVDASPAAGAHAAADDEPDDDDDDDDDGGAQFMDDAAAEALMLADTDDDAPDPNVEAMLAALGPAVGAADADHRAGFVSIVGSPNVGKSTLMNTLLGEQLSITTPKASTTRQRIMGIANEPGWQIVYSDTPGVVKPAYKMHEGMMGAVRCAIEDADVLLVITDVLETGFRDERMLRRVRDAGVPILVLVNKVDLVAQRLAHAPAVAGKLGGGAPAARAAPAPDARATHGGARAWEGAQADGEEGAPPPPRQLDLPSIRAWWRAQLPAAELLEVSALHGDNVDAVRERLLQLLPVHPPFFDKAQISDRPEKFFAGEVVRAQIFEQYADEIPYSCEVEVTAFKEADNKISCEATVHVLRDSQKGILIGAKGAQIKALTDAAERSLYRFFAKRFSLRLQVKVSKDWRANDSFLRQFGYLR